MKSFVSTASLSTVAQAVKAELPEHGTVFLLKFTEKQYQNMEVFRDQELVKNPDNSQVYYSF